MWRLAPQQAIYLSDQFLDYELVCYITARSCMEQHDDPGNKRDVLRRLAAIIRQGLSDRAPCMTHAVYTVYGIWKRCRMAGSYISQVPSSFLLGGRVAIP